MSKNAQDIPENKCRKFFINLHVTQMSQGNIKLKMKHLGKFCPPILYVQRHIIQNDFKIMPPINTDSVLFVPKNHRTLTEA